MRRRFSFSIVFINHHILIGPIARSSPYIVLLLKDSWLAFSFIMKRPIRSSPLLALWISDVYIKMFAFSFGFVRAAFWNNWSEYAPHFCWTRITLRSLLLSCISFIKRLLSFVGLHALDMTARKILTLCIEHLFSGMSFYIYNTLPRC